MNKNLLCILACPVCKASLELNIEKEDDKEVVSGSLKCVKCHEVYPIIDSIPNFIPHQIPG